MLNRTAEERALEGVRAELFSALRDKDPELFARLSNTLDEIKPDT